jgi:hypothetical protein
VRATGVAELIVTPEFSITGPAAASKMIFPVVAVRVAPEDSMLPGPKKKLLMGPFRVTLFGWVP